MNRAYYWYRPHPYFSKFYPGQILNPITDIRYISKYFSDPTRIALAKKYFPSGLSPHGLSMLLIHNPSDYDFQEPITEIIFELVRQIHFPDSPSRLCSMYASESIEQAELWYTLWYKNFKGSKNQLPQSLWEIEFEKDAKIYDANWLSHFPSGSQNGFSYLTELENAHHYWKNDFTQTPFPELLIPYPVKIVRILRDTDYM